MSRVTVRCSDGAVEDTRHFVECKATLPCRQDLEKVLRGRLPGAGDPGRILLDRFLRGSSDERLCMILGRRVSFPEHVLKGDPDGCAMAEYILDKATKNFLVQAWRKREEFTGVLRIVSGRLVSIPVPPRVVQSVRVTSEPPDSRLWEQWRYKPDTVWGTVGNRERSPFYVVSCGRRQGYFISGRTCGGVSLEWRYRNIGDSAL